MNAYQSKIRSHKVRIEIFSLILGCIFLSPRNSSLGEGRAPETRKPLSQIELIRLSLEELSEIRVTSVSRKSEQLSKTASAIYVISQEDIHEAAVISLPETLRLAPGMQVGRIDSHQWAISARGFNDNFANKLLVQIDGRSVYTRLFSGVFWDSQDTFLNDIDRIEVIRGPGATMWGSNAVNGVINVITKPSDETMGGIIEFGGGSSNTYFAGFRYGWELGEGLHFRIFSKFFERGNSTLGNAKKANDA